MDLFPPKYKECAANKMTDEFPDCMDILTTRNITWEQYFKEHGVILEPLIRRRIRRWEKKGYIATGFGFGWNGVHIVFMEHKDNENLEKVFDLHFIGDIGLPNML
jgi:hypothetical protein